MTSTERAPSARRGELLDAAYAYVLEHGLADVSLRPLAAAVGSSPRVLLFLFGSKDGLVRALLARARADELAAPKHRALLTLWLEGYSRSLVAPDGPWADFARAAVQDWLDILADAQPSSDTVDAEAEAERTLVLAVLRGALLDLLATGDVARTSRAVRTIMAEYGQT